MEYSSLRLNTVLLSGKLDLKSMSKSTQQIVQEALPNPQNFRFFSKVSSMGFVFRADGQSCVAFSDPREPKFALIVAIAKRVHNSTFFLVVQQLIDTYIENLDLLQVKPSTQYFTMRLSEIVLPRPLNIYSLKNSSEEIGQFITTYFWGIYQELNFLWLSPCFSRRFCVVSELNHMKSKNVCLQGFCSGCAKWNGNYDVSQVICWKFRIIKILFVYLSYTLVFTFSRINSQFLRLKN